MQPTLNEKFLAYLALVSGVTLSIVAEYYSILGLMAIFSAAAWSVVVMGIALGVGKITATLWLKQNWKIAPWSIRLYLLTAVAVLMLITSMGIFGFLSKAHSDQSLVSGDVLSKIAVYDEKIKTSKDNIDANRKALKQLDEAVDQVMGRSTDEKGAEKAVSIRRSQQKERARLQAEIQAEQKTISSISEERAPIAAEVRKVEAEVGPIKYIAAFVYGETDPTILEKAVTWVIIVLIVVFDPLAVILLLSSQISFQNFRERRQEEHLPYYVADVGEKPTAEELKDDLFPTYEEITPTEGDSPEKESDVISTATVTKSQDPHPPGWMFSDPIARDTEKEKSILEQHPYLKQPFAHFKNLQPMVHKPESITTEIIEPSIDVERPGDYITPPDDEISQIDWNKLPPEGYVTIKGERMNVKAARDMYGPKHLVSNYVQNEEQTESGIWNKVITEQEYRLKLEKEKNEPNNNPSNPT
jgi:hypothetical protein